MNIDFAPLSATERYRWMTQSLIPRPVAWVLTENDNGDYNLAPFSYFVALASEPALLGVSVGQKPDGTMKDTLHNIRARNRFVVHIAGEAQLDSLNETSATLPYGESEVTRQKLPTVDFGGGFSLPRLDDAPLAFACRSRHILALDEKNTQHFIIGEILRLYAADEVIAKDAEGRRTIIDADKVSPILRLGTGQYGTLNQVRNRKRPK